MVGPVPLALVKGKVIGKLQSPWMGWEFKWIQNPFTSQRPQF